LARRDLSDDQRIDSIRGMSGVMRLRQGEPLLPLLLPLLLLLLRLLRTR
jgi:hypothetical protein